MQISTAANFNRKEWEVGELPFLSNRAWDSSWNSFFKPKVGNLMEAFFQRNCP